jgi:hypothetical protein
MSTEWHDSDIHNVFVCAMLYDDMWTGDTPTARQKAAASSGSSARARVDPVRPSSARVDDRDSPTRRRRRVLAGAPAAPAVDRASRSEASPDPRAGLHARELAPWPLWSSRRSTREPWPTLGPQVCDLIEERMVFGPGSLQGEPAVLDDDKRAAIYSFYEVYPQGHEFAGRRRFKRCGYCVRKGLAKTELMAWVAEAELHPEGPVRCDGFDANGEPVGRPVKAPYIPLLAVTVEQVEELAYGALFYMVTEGPTRTCSTRRSSGSSGSAVG